MLIHLNKREDIQYIKSAFAILRENTGYSSRNDDFVFLDNISDKDLNIIIIPVDLQGNESYSYDDIIMFQWGSFLDMYINGIIDTNNGNQYIMTPQEFYSDIRNKYLESPKTKKSKTNNDNNISIIPIPIEIAKKMYLSSDEEIKKYILTIYPESKLKDPPYFKYKNINDICGDDFTSDEVVGPNFLYRLRDKLNEHLKIDYLFDDVYLPIIKIIPNIEISKYDKDKILAKFSIKSRVYFLVEGEDDEYIPVKGIFNLTKSNNNTVGGVSMHATYLAFGSPEIAKHAVKYFAKQIFEGAIWPFKDDLPITWLDIN